MLNLSENNDKLKNFTEKLPENNNPLSVRIDSQFKEIFNNIIIEKGMSKKQLLENMILNYIQDDIEQDRENQINFSNEVNLISTSLDEIFKIFKIIITKSQDTLASANSLSQQEIANLNSEITKLNNKISELDAKNESLVLSNNAYTMEKENLMNNIENINSNIAVLECENINVNKKNQELLEQLNTLRTIENNNHNLYLENEKLSQKIAKYNNMINSINTENENLSKKINYLESLLDDFSTRKKEEITEITQLIKKEAEIDKKIEILQIKTNFNDLQAENMRNLCIINEKLEEIRILNNTISELRSV